MNLKFFLLDSFVNSFSQSSLAMPYGHSGALGKFSSILVKFKLKEFSPYTFIVLKKIILKQIGNTENI